MNGIDCQGNVLILLTSVNMFKNKIDNYFKIVCIVWVCLDVSYDYNRTLDKPFASNCPVKS